MVLRKIPKLTAHCFITIIFLSFRLFPVPGTFIQEDPASIFDATITTEQDHFYINEEIKAIFNFSSHVTDVDYFAFGIAEDLGFNPIIQSPPVQGNFTISQAYSFFLMTCNYSFSGEIKILYLILYYYEGIFGDEICCSKAITIHKANLQCEFLTNCTEINISVNYNLIFEFYDSNNVSFALLEENVLCTILYDGRLHCQFNLLTDGEGKIYILLIVEELIEACELHLYVNTSQCFNTLEIEYIFNVNYSSMILSSSHSSSKIIVIIAVSVFLAISCSGLVYFGIQFYQKRLKRKYKVVNIKL